MKYELLRDKYLLLDTNILIDCSKYPIFFKDFLLNLTTHNIALVIDQTVRFEFLRNADSPKQKKVLDDFLKSLLSVDDIGLLIDGTTVSDAIYLANIYAWKNLNKIDLADCFLASAMKKFNESAVRPRMFLATQNHKDYPDFIFKRIGIETIDVAGNSIINIGFYEFNKDSFVQAHDDYKKQV